VHSRGDKTAGSNKMTVPSGVRCLPFSAERGDTIEQEANDQA